jgi:hypothetical protein
MSQSSSSVPGASFASDSGWTVVIAGSRSFPFSLFPERCLDEVGQAIATAGWPVGEVISGGAKGVDSAGAAWAERVGVPLVEIEPDWETHGKAAGPKRNTQMVRAADAVVALWNGESAGTRDTIGKARAALTDEQVHVHSIGDFAVAVSLTDVEPTPLD